MKQSKRLIQTIAVGVAGLFISATAVTAYAASPGVGAWNTTTTLPATLANADSVTYNGYVYEVGGYNGSARVSTVYYAPLNPNGTVGAWNTTTVLPSALDNTSTVVSKGYIYELGGQSNGGIISTVYYAPLNPNGTVGAWNTTTALPSALENTTAVVNNGYVYYMGGDNGSRTNSVYYAPLNPNGTVGAWNTTTVLPDSISYATSVVFNGYIYELGGSDSTANLNTVYYAKVNTNGTLGTWAATTALSRSLSAASAVTYNGYIYELGGLDGTGFADGSVYYTPINTNGTLGTWAATTALPPTINQIAASSVVYNGYVYELGGFGGVGTYLNNVYYAQLTGYPTPTLSPQSVSVSTGSSIIVNVVQGATGNPDPNSVSIVSGPSHGTAVDPSGTITYTPNKGYVGTDSLVYQVCSLNDEALCSQATLSFNVTAAAPDTGYGRPIVSNPWETFGLYGSATLSLFAIAIGMRKLSSTKSK